MPARAASFESATKIAGEACAACAKTASGDLDIAPRYSMLRSENAFNICMMNVLGGLLLALRAHSKRCEYTTFRGLYGNNHRLTMIVTGGGGTSSFHKIHAIHCTTGTDTTGTDSEYTQGGRQQKLLQVFFFFFFELCFVQKGP